MKIVTQCKQGMWKASVPLVGLLMMTMMIIVSVGCQGNLNSRAAVASTDTLTVDSSDRFRELSDAAVEDIERKQDGSLTERWRNPARLPVDTLHPISADSLARWTKYERIRVRDSVRQELDKLPKHIYFTFDDGPLRGSSAVDSICRAKGIKVSVFLVGKHADMSNKLKKYLQRYRDNPLIACYNHSYSHGGNRFTTFYNNPLDAYDDFERNEKTLDLKHKIVRLPGRNMWVYDDMRRIDLQSGASTADMLYAHGYKVFGWDIEWKINSTTGKPVQSIDELYTRIRHYMGNKSSLEPNNVVLLMHDDMFRNTKGQQLLASLIDTIQTTTDYRFEFMTDYPFRY